MKIVVWRCHCQYCTSATRTYPQAEIWWERGEWWMQPHRVTKYHAPLKEARKWARGWAESSTYRQAY